MQFTVKVNKTHIKNGVPCSIFGCPIALALEDAGFYRVVVGLMSVEATRGAVRYMAPTSCKIKRFIGHFDTHKDVTPDKFRLNLIEVS